MRECGNFSILKISLKFYINIKLIVLCDSNSKINNKHQYLKRI